jgi:gingipain R
VTRDIDPANLERTFGPDYGNGRIFPASVVEMGRPFLLGDSRGVNLRLNPVRWDAARGVLLVTEAITIEVTTTGTGGVNVLPTAVPVSSREFRTLRGEVLPNVTAADGLEKYSAPVARGRMLIISADAFAPALDSFRAWKARRGIATDLVLMSETDGTAAGLRSLVATRYQTTPGLTWLVLVGDKAQVPTNVGTYDGSDTDSRYAMLLGDDLYPELLVSRISASTIQHVETQVAKFINYERNPDTGAAAAWYGQAAGVASDEGVPADYERADLLRTSLLSRDYTSVDRLYQGLGASTSALAAAVNQGRSLINYLGHGSGLSWDSVVFRNSDVTALTNGTRLPWIIDVSCYNGDFARTTCFAEAWLRAGTAGAPAGAIGMIAASSLAPWTPPTVMQAEIVGLLAAGTQGTLGALYYSGLMKVLDEYAGVPVATQVMEQNIVFGDGSLQVRTREPGKFQVVMLSSLEASGGQINLQVSGSGAGTVAVTLRDVLIAAVDFSGPGLVSVPVNADLSGVNGLDVTVTGANMVPWLGTAAVVMGATPVLDAGLPLLPVLRGNYPNPFNPRTSIVFELPQAQAVALTVYDIRGRQVGVLVAGETTAGTHEVIWEGRDSQGKDLPSGVYLYRLVTAGGTQTGRMILAK